MMKSIRTLVLGVLACIGLAFNSYAEQSIGAYVYSAVMYASADASAQFDRELAYQASLPDSVLKGTVSGLVRDSHGYLQLTADEAGQGTPLDPGTTTLNV